MLKVVNDLEKTYFWLNPKRIKFNKINIMDSKKAIRHIQHSKGQ